ncbi:MAG: sulfatase [Parasphingorhabdus sp.]
MAEQSERPNIILLSVDCWRGDHIGLQDGSATKTPNIDKFARQATWFSNHYTCGGWTKIAMTALFSSTYSSQFNFAQGKIESERPMLADQLQAAGYKTIGITSNPVCGAAQGFDRGFDEFVDIQPVVETSLVDRIFALRGSGIFLSRRLVRKFLSLVGMHPDPPRPACNAGEVINQGLSRLKESHDKPFFLWLHFMDLHWPYQSAQRPKTSDEKEAVWKDRILWKNNRSCRGQFDPGPERSERWKQLYREELEEMDRHFGNLFDALYEMENWENTHVVLTSDHGEEFFEHGTWAHSWNQMHKEGAHVPLIVHKAKTQQVPNVAKTVSQIDIAPTILDLADVSQPQSMLGQSLTGSLANQNESEQRPVYSEMHGHRNSTIYRLSIIHDGYKYIYDGDRDCCFLFEISKDQDERHDIYNKDDSVSRRFDQLRLKHVSTGFLNILRSKNPVIGEDILYDIDADPKVVERLRALGYLD